VTAFIGSGTALVGTWLRGDVALAREWMVLNARAAASLLAMTRRLYPHDRLGDEYYRAVVEGIDADMAGDSALRALIMGGITALTADNGVEFPARPLVEQIAALTAVENTPFFAALLERTTHYLYNNPAVWPHFGFEGSSSERGGYLERGFDDGDWIPDS